MKIWGHMTQENHSLAFIFIGCSPVCPAPPKLVPPKPPSLLVLLENKNIFAYQSRVCEERSRIRGLCSQQFPGSYANLSCYCCRIMVCNPGRHGSFPPLAESHPEAGVFLRIKRQGPGNTWVGEGVNLGA